MQVNRSSSNKIMINNRSTSTGWEWKPRLRNQKVEDRCACHAKEGWDKRSRSIHIGDVES